jgi:hypothetical protein
MIESFTGSLRFLDLSVHVSTGSVEAWSRIRQRYPHWLHEDTAGPHAGTIEVTYDERLGSGVVHGGASPAVFKAWSEGLAAIQVVIDSIAVRNLTACALVHAGLVLLDGVLIMLPAPSWSGKSTLVTDLVSRGAHYYSDELAILDEDAVAHPYQRPLIRRDPEGGLIHESTAPMIPPEELPRRRPDLILFLQYRADAELVIRPIGKDRALIELLRNTPQTWRDRPGIVPIFTKAVSSSDTYEGQRGEARAVADLLPTLRRGGARPAL